MSKIVSPFDLDETFFNRNQFYGWDFSWYAIDSVNSIAQFTSGHLPIPTRVFFRKAEYEKVNSFFESLPFICNSWLSPAYKKIENRSVNGFATILNEAQRGISMFEEPTNSNRNFYHLCAVPEIYLKFEDLPEEIQNYLNFFKIDSIKFSDTEKISVTDYFICDLTPQVCQ